NGRITASKAMLLCDAVDTALPKKVLLSGPAKMKENVLRGLDLAGFPTQDIRYEDFHHPPHLDAPLLPECEVSAEHAGKSIRFTYHPNQESLMEAISKRGLDAPQACRGGVCGSCRASINEGEVSVDQDFALTKEEKNQGWVLCCQATPKTSKISLTFKEGQ
ncbi:MAG: 2Fe-2S iron-sulfur cluster-binding protein, partial [Flavobacteriales bacterium]